MATHSAQTPRTGRGMRPDLLVSPTSQRKAPARPAPTRSAGRGKGPQSHEGSRIHQVWFQRPRENFDSRLTSCCSDRFKETRTLKCSETTEKLRWKNIHAWDYSGEIVTTGVTKKNKLQCFLNPLFWRFSPSQSGASDCHLISKFALSWSPVSWPVAFPVLPTHVFAQLSYSKPVAHLQLGSPPGLWHRVLPPSLKAYFPPFLPFLHPSSAERNREAEKREGSHVHPQEEWALDCNKWKKQIVKLGV